MGGPAGGRQHGADDQKRVYLRLGSWRGERSHAWPGLIWVRGLRVYGENHVWVFTSIRAVSEHL